MTFSEITFGRSGLRKSSSRTADLASYRGINRTLKESKPIIQYRLIESSRDVVLLISLPFVPWILRYSSNFRSIIAMRPSTLPWRLGYSLALGTLLCSSVVLGGPAVSVALKASFNAGPYLLELL